MVNERERFIKAFNEELEAHPDTPPGPTAIRRRMGLRPANWLNGRLSPLRRQMLKDAGFEQKTDVSGRWYKS